MCLFLRNKHISAKREEEERVIITQPAQSHTFIYCFHCGLGWLPSMLCVKQHDRNDLPASDTFLLFYE